MKDSDKKKQGNIKGAQTHAEGQHGERTHERLREQISEFRPRGGDDNVIATHDDGRHRLDEDRQQHDEADKNSEFNRQDKRR